MTSIAIIPARGGSKRIPRKNVRSLAGKPAIAYPIDLALKSGLFERVIVSTDDQEIASIALKFGAEIPFIRSTKLGDDFTTTVEVISDAVQKLELRSTQYVCCIYPVTPLLIEKRLEQAHELLKAGNWDYVFPACEYSTPIERSFRKNPSGKVDFLNSNYETTRTQDLEKTFYDAGQFYFGITEAWLNKVPILSGNSTFIELEKNETVDVDELADWDLVEFLLKARRQKN